MKEFLFRKNLWTIDFITSIIYALCHGYFFNLIIDNPEWYEIRILIYGVSAYVFTFFLALYLQKKVVWLPSWAWLGIFGTLIHVLFLKLTTFHREIDYQLKYSSSFLEAVSKIIFYLFSSIMLRWIVWAILVLICIFTVRFFMYLFFANYISYNKYKTGFPKK